MKSYTEGRTLYGTMTKNTSSDNLSLGDQIANDDYRSICAAMDWPFLERLRTITTVASQQAYDLPYDCDLVRSVSVVVSSKRYTPRLSPSQEHWDSLNLTSYTSDIPEFYYVQSGQVLLWPTPVSAGNTIRITQKTTPIDLSVADYTDGTITTATNGDATITGSGTTFTDNMVGRYMRITYADTANTGDGLWYEIASVTSATELELVREYGGNSIAAGSASYIIGQMPLLPEAFHELPWYKAIGEYWIKEGDSRGARYLEMHGEFPSRHRPASGKIANLIKAYSSPTTDMITDEGYINDEELINPNLTVSL